VLTTLYSASKAVDENIQQWQPPKLPRCMECRRGLAMRILSVCQTRVL